VQAKVDDVPFVFAQLATEAVVSGCGAICRIENCRRRKRSPETVCDSRITRDSLGFWRRKDRMKSEMALLSLLLLLLFVGLLCVVLVLQSPFRRLKMDEPLSCQSLTEQDECG
jgi:hypothetical protein